MKKIICFLLGGLPCLFAFSQSLGQKAVVAAGNSASGGGITLAWTLGEAFAATLSGGATTLTVGFQQPLVQTTLPILWLRVEGSLNAQKFAVLRWEAEEQEVLNYTIERATQANTFMPIGNVPAVGNGANAYSFTEASPLTSGANYRIKQTDAHGQTTYSRTILLRPTGEKEISLFPNPVTSSTVLSVRSSRGGSLLLRLADAGGRTVLEKTVAINAGTQLIPLNIASLPSGRYTLSVTGDEAEQSLPLLKQ